MLLPILYISLTHVWKGKDKSRKSQTQYKTRAGQTQIPGYPDIICEQVWKKIESWLYWTKIWNEEILKLKLVKI